MFVPLSILLLLSYPSMLGASQISCMCLQPGLRHGCLSLVGTITCYWVLCFMMSRLPNWFVVLHSRVFWHIWKSEGPIWSDYVSVWLSGILVVTAFFLSPVMGDAWLVDIFLEFEVAHFYCHGAKNPGIQRVLNGDSLKLRIWRCDCSSPKLNDLSKIMYYLWQKNMVRVVDNFTIVELKQFRVVKSYSY